MEKLKRAGSNWVVSDQFFDRDADIRELKARIEDGIHTLLTAQRRMGKTSLVRETLRRLDEESRFKTIFVDLENASDPADAVAEIATRCRSVQGVGQRVKAWLANLVPEEASLKLPMVELHAKMRAVVDPGSWRQKGDEIFAALAANDQPVVLAIDEFAILVNQMLKGHDYHITPERTRAVDELLGWIRKNGQEHQGRVCMIVSGSVGLGPILRQGALGARMNIFSTFDLKPWDEDTAAACLAALAETYELDLPRDVRLAMCRRLRCQVPHHVQGFFNSLYEDLRRNHRSGASLEDVERVYVSEMLGVRGQLHLDHYETRLKLVLGEEGYATAIEMLTEAAVNGVLPRDAIARYRGRVRDSHNTEAVPAEHVLNVLEHDGYLEKHGDGHRFVSGLLEDWWRERYGHLATGDRPRQRAEP